MTAQVEKRLFSIEDYHKMIDAGILTPDDRVELINGEIIIMSPIKSAHASIVDILSQELVVNLHQQATIRTQNPISISNHSEPEPDIAVVINRSDRYRNSHPLPNETLLVIEVSDSTLIKDQKIKAPLYAQANISEYWIVNIPEQQIEIYCQPKNGQYLARNIVPLGQIATSSSINFSIDTSILF